ncbi:MAG: 2'-5' RNA ligase family protein [Sphingobacteriales bacterium]|nr:MAG: 2'-5' RNA ligase family protein [Sphingobacteriales bacterium]
MTKNTRRQLTLFVHPKDAETIELVRQQFNPIQFSLIKSHVTLCREDEIKNLDQVISNLHSLTQNEIVIEFGNAIRFDNGKGVLLPAIIDNIDFQNLRRQVLLGLTDNPRKHEAHITLMHPRNSTCTDAIFHQIEKVSLPKQLRFNKISLIEQEDGRQWNILQDFEFIKTTKKLT